MIEVDTEDFKKSLSGCDFKWADSEDDENPGVTIELIPVKGKLVTKKITVGDEIQYERKQ